MHGCLIGISHPGELDTGVQGRKNATTKKEIEDLS
jgi:hypothetical protein